jgi:hypothetical protein
MAETASAAISAAQLDATHWKYSITLSDTGSTTIGTFWFGWVPGKDFLDSQPSQITDPAGWTSQVTHGGSSDGFAIQWVVSPTSTDLGAGGVLSGFSFVSTDAPAALFGNSNFYPNTPVPTSFVYSGVPFSDAGFEFVATEAPCFLPGTQILTDRGEVAVEKLRVGDIVVTLGGRRRVLRWIGHGSALATSGRRSAVTPVVVRKSALSDNVPNRDLHVTKGHAMFLDDVLIPVEFLINHRSIVWDDRAREVTVYHLELDTHDVLLANGTPAESYRDDGNRWMFKNANSGWGLPAKGPCAPVLTGGPVVDAVWRRILDRADPRPGLPLTDDPGMHLIVDGARLEPAMQAGDICMFTIDHGPREVRLASRAAAPQEIGLARDPRCLGVAVRRIVVRQGARFRTFFAQDQRLAQGFHGFEPTCDLRWTDGDAALPPEMFIGFTGPLEVVLLLGSRTRYIADAAASRAA